MDKKEARKWHFLDNIRRSKLRAYLRHTNEFFEASSDELTEQIKELEKSDSDFRYYRSQFDNKKVLFNATFRNFHHSSFLVLCYSDFEKKLIDICNIEIRNRGLKQKLPDFNRDILTNVAKYTTEYMGIDIKKNSKLWDDIKTIQKIRNTIVHKNGILVNSNKNATHIRTYINKRHDITIEKNHLILSQEYCNYVLETFGSFFDNLYNQFTEQS